MTNLTLKAMKSCFCFRSTPSGRDQTTLEGQQKSRQTEGRRQQDRQRQESSGRKENQSAPVEPVQEEEGGKRTVRWTSRGNRSVTFLRTQRVPGAKTPNLQTSSATLRRRFGNENVCRERQQREVVGKTMTNLRHTNSRFWAELCNEN